MAGLVFVQPGADPVEEPLVLGVVWGPVQPGVDPVGELL